MLSSLAPARRRLVLGMLGVLLVALVAGVVAVVRSQAGDGTGTTDDLQTRPVSQAKPGPVLLVPGYGGSTTGLDSLATTLRRKGKTVEVFPLPGNGEGDLNAQARSLASAAATLRTRTGAASLDVVGYSAGGVVARLWIRDFGGAAMVRRVITLGSPHHGTDLAGLAGSLLPTACPTACQQLEPDSSLLADLNQGDETPAGPSYVSIWTTHDNVVLPPDSARLSGALDMTVQSVCAGDRVDHSGLPTDPAVQAIVALELRAGAPTRLGPSACVSS